MLLNVSVFNINLYDKCEWPSLYLSVASTHGFPYSSVGISTILNSDAYLSCLNGKSIIVSYIS